MNIRVVEENNPLRQSLLEMYVAVALAAQYNDFDNLEGAKLFRAFRVFRGRAFVSDLEP